MVVSFISQVEKPEQWLPELEQRLPDLKFSVHSELSDLGEIEIALVAKPQPGVLATLPRLKFIQSLWMGVNDLLSDEIFPRHVPLSRLVDPGMVSAMGETVLAHVIDLHRDLHHYRNQQTRREWYKFPQRRAKECRVGILGLGVLGTDAARKLRALGFQVSGWSRRLKTIDGIDGYTGVEGLKSLLSGTDILICLLPLTNSTTGIINKSLIAELPRGASVVNLSRGAHVVEQDLLDALDSGHLSRAVLDAFNVEPLASTHPFWAHPSITVTPHVAAITDPVTSIPEVVENIERVCSGRQPRYLVDVKSGY